MNKVNVAIDTVLGEPKYNYRAWILAGLTLLSWGFLFFLWAAITPAFATQPLGYQFFCTKHAIECEHSGAQSINFDDFALVIVRVNHDVNASIRPKADKGDVWSLSPLAGDCEDYALTKRSILRKAGVPTNAMKIGVLTLPSGENHAVLVITTDKGDVVLDNLARDVKVRSRSMRFI